MVKIVKSAKLTKYCHFNEIDYLSFSEHAHLASKNDDLSMSDLQNGWTFWEAGSQNCSWLVELGSFASPNLAYKQDTAKIFSKSGHIPKYLPTFRNKCSSSRNTCKLVTIDFLWIWPVNP